MNFKLQSNLKRLKENLNLNYEMRIRKEYLAKLENYKQTCLIEELKDSNKKILNEIRLLEIRFKHSNGENKDLYTFKVISVIKVILYNFTAIFICWWFLTSIRSYRKCFSFVTKRKLRKRKSNSKLNKLELSKNF